MTWFPLGFNICNIVGILLGLCSGLLLVFALGKKLENQEGLLDSDCVVSLMGVVWGLIIDISVGKPYVDKLGC